METVDEMALFSACMTIAAIKLNLEDKPTKDWTESEQEKVKFATTQTMKLYRQQAQRWFSNQASTQN